MITKLAGKNVHIDLQKNRIDFLDNRFYITEAGNLVPSVTTILDCYPKSPQFYDWLKKMGEDADAIRDEAGERGSTVHKLTEFYDEGQEVSLLNENGSLGYKLSEWAMFERYIDFRKRFPVEIIHTELHLSSDTLGTAGTLDRVIRFGNKVLIVDLKTSNVVSDHFWLQLAAYKKLLAEVQPDLHIDGYAILHLNAKTRTEGRNGAIQGPGWQFIERDAWEHDRDWHLFQATQQLYIAERGDMKPKQLSYSLSHKL